MSHLDSCFPYIFANRYNTWVEFCFEDIASLFQFSFWNPYTQKATLKIYLRFLENWLKFILSENLTEQSPLILWMCKYIYNAYVCIIMFCGFPGFCNRHCICQASQLNTHVHMHTCVCTPTYSHTLWLIIPRRTYKVYLHIHCICLVVSKISVFH